MIDTVEKKGKWEFDKEVADVFDDMLERSIPAYEAMRDLTTRIGFKYVKPKTSIVDIGCSNGNAIKPYIDKFGCLNTYKLYDVSEPMLDIAREKYKNWVDIGVMSIRNFDICGQWEPMNASVILSVLTLQFTPIEHRAQIVKNIYDSLCNGGALIMVEKVLGKTYEIDEMLKKCYYEIKSENRYTQEQIESKRKALEGVLQPLNTDWNKDILENAGFKHVDIFWRYLNFEGTLAIKR